LAGRGNLTDCGYSCHCISLSYNENEVATPKVRFYVLSGYLVWRNNCNQLKKSHIGFVLAALAVLAGGVFTYRNVAESGFHWAEFVGSLARVRWGWVAASLPAILLTYFVRALRWRVLIRPVTPEVSLWKITTATCIGFTAVVLFGRAGEAVRPYLIARHHKVPISTQVAGWLVERILDVLMVMLLFGVALTQVGDSPHGLAPGPKMRIALETGGWLAGLTAVACLAVLIGLRLFRGEVHNRIGDSLTFLPEPLVQRIRDFLAAFDEGMQSTRERSSIVPLVGYTVAVWFLVGEAFYSVFRAFPSLNSLQFSDIVMTLGFVAFASVLQLPGVGGGIQIATVLVLTEMYHVPIEASSGVALMVWLTSFLSIVPIGLIFAFHEGLKWRNMRHVGDDPAYKL